ncbi:hypothetical protein ADIARSV_3813 [Arcticibacter svalbardensis MN12-7]|uniref:Uncharacterized protein n=1 Tax=Arcticibacter svalbardensis MN12-7 TaxID=1150600 RepID=R9GMQ6_9SPHI|nr:hypothetical protein ADIARSV_3813 [Arcticibacter svalbardensis MN12-7]
MNREWLDWNMGYITIKPMVNWPRKFSKSVNVYTSHMK